MDATVSDDGASEKGSNTMTHTILGLDCSSTTIGWVLWDGTQAAMSQTITLKGELLQRMRLAERCVMALIDRHGPDVVAIEGPTTRFANHVIAQQRVCGVVLLVIDKASLLSLEIAPATAKKALTGTGKADKALMVRNAEGYLGACDEHQADALGVAMAAWPLVRMGEMEAV